MKPTFHPASDGMTLAIPTLSGLRLIERGALRSVPGAPSPPCQRRATALPDNPVLDEVRALRSEVSDLNDRVRSLDESVRSVRSLVNTGRTKYNLEGAASRLGVSVKTVRRRIDTGELAPSREGGRVFVTESAIRDYEDARRRAA